MAEGGKVKNIGNKVSAQQKARQAYESPRMRVRENKHATDAGLTPEQRKAANKTENAIRNRKTEVVYSIDEQGNVTKSSYTGNARRARVLPGAIKPNSVITHNHPDSQDQPVYMNGRRIGVRGGGQGMGARIGSSLSGADIRSAILTNAKEIRAVSPTYTFSIRRPEGGWGVSASQVLSEWQNEYNRFVNANREYARSSREALGRVNAVASHQATRTIAKKYGFTYTRRKSV